MSDKYKVNLVNAGLLKELHKIESCYLNMPERELIMRAAKLILYFLPKYNYAIWRLEKLSNKTHNNKFEDVVFEEYIVFKEHCYGISIFKKGQLMLKRKKKCKHPGQLVYGGPIMPQLLLELPEESSRCFRFLRKRPKPLLVNFLAADNFDKEEQFDQALEKLKRQFGLNLDN